MATVQLKLGPLDHGRRLTLDDFEEAESPPGFRYEIIDGRLYVSPEPNPKENVLEEWIGFHLRLYSRGRPEVVNYVTAKSRVFVHARPEDTVPEPDLTAYRAFPLDQDFDDIRWDEQSPVLV